MGALAALVVIMVLAVVARGELGSYSRTPEPQFQIDHSEPYTPEPSSWSWGAFFLGLFLGPVGLWSRGGGWQGFAWLVMTVLTAPTYIGVPICWIGMAVHAGHYEEATR